jgi:hypothetical protein
LDARSSIRNLLIQKAKTSLKATRKYRCSYIISSYLKDDIDSKIYRMKYLSRMEFLFMPSRLLAKSNQVKQANKLLVSLPYVIKHTLFLEADMMTKMRELSDIG